MKKTILYFTLWYLSGVTSFVYWYTTEFDLTLQAAMVGLAIGTIGPLAFPVG